MEVSAKSFIASLTHELYITVKAFYSSWNALSTMFINVTFQSKSMESTADLGKNDYPFVTYFPCRFKIADFLWHLWCP